MDLSCPVGEFKGIGKKRSEGYEKMGIRTIADLLYHFPRSYTDYSSPVEINSAMPETTCVIKAYVTKKLPEQRIRKGMTIYKAVLTDFSGDITAVFYNNQYAFAALKENTEYFLSGKVTGNFTRKEINSPTVVTADSDNLLRPLYHLTDGITNNMLYTNMHEALKIFDDAPYDILPKEILEENKLCSLGYALNNIHFPKDSTALEIARKRLAFEELFVLQLGMLTLRGRNRELTSYSFSGADMALFYDSLPFPLTSAQKKAVGEILSDMTGNVPMNRLLQGDVGSGKTVVAAAACYAAVRGGCQAALMAPTEILANQHFATLSGFLEPLGIKIVLLTGALTPKNKAQVREQIKSGAADVIVGTHALVQLSTEFSALGLVITDEQHRFGVNQRATLAEKGHNPHKLVMSATPIPRTLGLIIYGDLDISVLDELPKGRLPIETYAITGKGLRQRAYGFVKKHLDEGRQGYMVCPMIEESEGDLKSVKAYAESLSEGAFSGYTVGLLHGKMPAADKDKIMGQFKDGEIQLLVSTTVIEVGVDVPNAVIMLIENADRFGLSQLHQLRGRVGRGKYQSYCILLTDNPSEECRERIGIMSRLSDGFKIAEEDMRLRGCGNFFGEMQHGLPPLRIAQLDSQTLELAQNAAKSLFERDFKLDDYPQLKSAVDRLFDVDKEKGMN